MLLLREICVYIKWRQMYTVNQKKRGVEGLRGEQIGVQSTKKSHETTRL